MSALLTIGRQCHRTTNLFSSSLFRTFATTPSVQARKNKNESKIRIPSKKAMAAKAKRRAAKVALADAKLEKLSLMDAINVLRVSLAR